MLKIAQLPQPQRLETALADASRAARLDAARWGAVMAGVLGFLCFMPYLAIPAGANTAIQFGNIFTILLVVPLLFAKGRRGPIWIFLLIVAPLCTSALKVGFDEHGDIALCFKTIPVFAMSCLTLVAAQRWAPRHSLALLTGIAIAILIHVAVGGWQFYSFSTGGDLPLKSLYANPSFWSVQDSADVISQYVQRPFGLFPEPSAMSSSLAPWVLFWVAELCGIVKLKVEPARWQRMLFTAAAAGGLGLIILSQSGHAAVTLAAAVLFVAIWFVRCRATAGSFLTAAAVLGIAMPVTLYFAAAELGTRVGGQSDLGNSSWEDRTESLEIGYSLLVDRDLKTIVFGVGSGLTGPELQRIARLEAVWSVLLTYVYETGLIGLAAASWIAIYLLRLWNSSGRNPAFAAILVVWTVGVTVTTSYGELLPIWLALGWLTIWPELCQSPANAPRRHPSSTFGPAPIVEHPRPDPYAVHVRPPQWISHGWRDAAVNSPEMTPVAPISTTPAPPARWSAP
jgi:hypothetical protein